MKYLFLELEVTDGEREYNCPSVHELADNINTDSFSEEYAKGFYGDDEYLDEEDEIQVKKIEKEDGGYYLLGGEIHVKVYRYEEILKEQYDILKQYL